MTAQANGSVLHLRRHLWWTRMGKHSGNESRKRQDWMETRLPRALLAACQLRFSFTNAGMHLCGIFSGGKLVEQLLILVHDAVPVIEVADPVRSAPAVIFCKLRPIFNELNFRCQIGSIPK